MIEEFDVKMEFPIPDITDKTRIDLIKVFIYPISIDDFMKIVSENIKTTEHNDTIDRMKEQILDASSQIFVSLSVPRVFEMPLIISKVNLFKNNEIIMGKINRTITIIAIIPQELFISDRLAEIVFKDSPIKPPTTGIKLPIANFAVLKERVSMLCDKTL